MSYDIDLHLPEHGAPNDRTALESLEDGAMSESEKARNLMLAALLQAQTPGFELFESDKVVELTDTASESGIQISLFAKSGGVSMPYWHETDAAALFEQIAKYLKLLHEEGGFVAYDPQTEREVTADSSYSLDPATYSFGVRALKAATQKPWWKFW